MGQGRDLLERKVGRKCIALVISYSSIHSINKMGDDLLLSPGIKMS